MTEKAFFKPEIVHFNPRPTGVFIQGDSKKMSPLAFKLNNLQMMRRTTLPDTAFERADNFLSNECIHARFTF